MADTPFTYTNRIILSRKSKSAPTHSRLSHQKVLNKQESDLSYKTLDLLHLSKLILANLQQFDEVFKGWKHS